MYTSVTETFRDKTVLITGGTGFLGKLLTEKLLRSCPVAAVAVLVRGKKGLAAGQRVAEIYGQSLFDRLRRENPSFMNRIKVIEGNVEHPSMGMSTSDREWTIENVNLVFHCAATIKFNETLGLATKINIQGTEKLLELAAEMKHIQGIVHVSTAYSHCLRDEIDEQYYPVTVNLEELKSIDEPSINILKNWPNTYTFTKAIAENLVSTNPSHLPISIFRPSIIGSTVSEPDPGWVLNLNGPSGVVTSSIVGFLRILPIATGKIADIIPADYTVNALISVMWDTVNRYQDFNQMKERPTIYNYVSSAESPITWGRFNSLVYSNYKEAPPLQSMWYMFLIFYTNLLIGYVLKFFFHWVPAAFMDLSLIVCGKNSRTLKMYAKVEFMMDMLRVFTTRQWKFKNGNTRRLWSSMSQGDRKTFWFSLDKFDWASYMNIYYYGIRKHILREDLSNIEKALAKNHKLLRLHQAFVVCIVFLAFQILYWIFIRHLY